MKTAIAVFLILLSLPILVVMVLCKVAHLVSDYILDELS